MSELNLLEKTELWVSEILLEQANLTEMAAAVARVLGLPEDKVMVVDVRPTHVTFDLVEREILQENILGREEALLSALAEVPGVHLTADSHVHSNGILGLICAREEHPEEILRRVEAMRSEIVERVSRRAIVFPTGFEVEQGLIEDTNTPYLRALLEEHGYTVTVGPVIPDDEAVMTEVLSDALSRGFGLILTSGGVGAEDKDHSVESVLNVAPDAAAPYVVRYEKGHGRHVKDGVRIGVGRVGLATLVTLPGPHDEVEMTAPVLLQMLEEGRSCEETAERLAGILAQKWRSRNWHHGNPSQG